MNEYFTPDGTDAGDASEAFEAYSMGVHMAAFGEDSRFADAPDPDNEADPEFAGIPWIMMVEYIDDYEHDMRQQEHWEYEVQRYGEIGYW